MKYTILQGALLASSGIKLVSGRSLWSSSPATHASKASDDYLLKTGYVIGNGKLGGKAPRQSSGTAFPIDPF